ncbi:argininosuccinate lyase [Acuticoccus sediminis]|uniref:argininosuccinate lyase n=1 Tax=Acuticoccus sediminis TaxID=2184697 RepID=A0A8B2NHB1_9HYPH|nr:argininosuccinate lyase [Acuticoccus sediminis]RAH97313.1 argininosuccinate lyase [Acuticoccus sediminis]
MTDRPTSTDTTTFPDPVYARTVLAPLYGHAKTVFAEPLMRINRAHCVMLAETGILAGDEARQIASALAAIEASDILAPSPYTGAHEDLFFEVEGALKARVGNELGGKLHTGRSRNDLDHAIFRLRLKAVIDAMLDVARTTAWTMLDAARANKGEIIVAYTHGQPAQPTTYGHYLAGALETLLADIGRLDAARALVDRSPMGAAAITTTGFPVDRARMAGLLGFAEPTLNSYASIAGVDYVTAPYSALALMMLHLGRVVQDLQFWTSFEVGQLYVANSLVQISSIMPQKRNPVPIEHMRHLASTALGQAETVVRTMHNTPFTDMNDSEAEVQVTGLAAFATAGRVLDLLAAVLGGARVEPENVRRNIDRSCITITELADTLVRDEGLSFREGHEIASAVATAVVAGKGVLSDAYPAFAAAFERLAGRPSRLDEDAFRAAVGPEHFVAVRERHGGPGPAAMAAALETYRARLGALEEAAVHHAEREAVAAAALSEAFGALSGAGG